jgi:hypothetical protein
MTKKILNSPPHPGPLFEWVKKAQALSSQSSNPPPSGSLDIDSEFRAAVSADIKASPFSRYQIAARMSELVGQEITESMFNNWTSEAHEKHRFPCQFLPAFVVATGGRRAFECLSRRSGLFALPGPEALRAEIHRLDEQIKDLQEEKQKRKLFLREIDAEKRGRGDTEKS